MKKVGLEGVALVMLPSHLTHFWRRDSRTATSAGLLLLLHGCHSNCN